MIKSKVKTISKSEKADRLKRVIMQAKGAYVTVGLHQDAGQYPGANAPQVVEVALWQEFGTEKIPQRSFFRSTIDEHEGKINAWREEAIGNIIDKGWTVEKALEMIGFRIQLLIQNKIKSNVPPPYGTGKGNPADVIAKAQARKQATGVAPVTLIDSGLMLRSVTFKVFSK